MRINYKGYLLKALLWGNLVAPLSAQQTYVHWPTDSARWVIDEYRKNGHGGMNLSDVFHYWTGGDTIIQERKYTVIKSRGEQIGMPNSCYWVTDNKFEYKRFVRDDSNGRVFIRYPYEYFQDSTEFLLYDFNLQVGDTMWVKVINDNCQFKDTFGTITYVNDSVRYGDGIDRKLMDSNVEGIWRELGPNFATWQTEGIGLEIHPFYPELPLACCTKSTLFEYGLRCYKWKGNNVYNECPFPIGIESSKFTLQQHWDKRTQELVILNSSLDSHILQLWNILGQNIGQYYIEPGIKIIRLENYPKILVLNAYAKNGEGFSKKIFLD